MQLFPLRTHWLWVTFGLNCLSGPQGRVWMTRVLSWGCRGAGPVETGPQKPLPQCILMAVAAAASGRGSWVAVPTAHPAEVCSTPRQPRGGVLFPVLSVSGPSATSCVTSHGPWRVAPALVSRSDPHQTRTVAPKSCSPCLFWKVFLMQPKPLRPFMGPGHDS